MINIKDYHLFHCYKKNNTEDYSQYARYIEDRINWCNVNMGPRINKKWILLDKNGKIFSANLSYNLQNLSAIGIKDSECATYFKLRFSYE